MKILKTYNDLFESKLPGDINNLLSDLKAEFGEIIIEKTIND